MPRGRPPALGEQVAARRRAACRGRPRLAPQAARPDPEEPSGRAPSETVAFRTAPPDEARRSHVGKPHRAMRGGAASRRARPDAAPPDRATEPSREGLTDVAACRTDRRIEARRVRVAARRRVTAPVRPGRVSRDAVLPEGLGSVAPVRARRPEERQEVPDGALARPVHEALRARAELRARAARGPLDEVPGPLDEAAVLRDASPARRGVAPAPRGEVRELRDEVRELRGEVRVRQAARERAPPQRRGAHGAAPAAADAPPQAHAPDVPPLAPAPQAAAGRMMDCCRP